jgi:polyisoprenoid-binding protein YceI
MNYMAQGETTMTTTQGTSPTLTAGRWAVEPAHSSIGFTVRHLGLSKVRGQFNTFTGSVEIADDILASSVSASVDLSSIDTNNPDRDGHLRSTDFFGVDDHPQMTFTSTSITTSTLSGDLTLNGITKPVSFDLEFHGVAVDGYGMTRAGFSAAGRILRSDYGIDFNMPVGLDGMLIGDKIDIELEVQAVPVA